MRMRADAIVHISINMAALSGRLRARISEDAAESGSVAVPALAVACGALDVAGAPPRRRLFRLLADYATVPQQRERLEYFASSEGRDDLATYCARERRSLLDVRHAPPPVATCPALQSPSHIPPCAFPRPSMPALQVSYRRCLACG